MTIEFHLPELGEDIETGDVVNILVAEGDKVKKDQPLMEIETDKAVIELPSPDDGVVKNILTKVGDTINVGQHIVTIDNDNGSIKKVSKVESENDKKDESKSEINELSTETSHKTEHENEEPEPSQYEMSESNEEQPTHPNKKRADVIDFTLKDKSKIDYSKPEVLPASPSIRRLAREIGVDISNVQGTGPGGRITEDDIKEYSRIMLSSTKTTSEKPEDAIHKVFDSKDKNIRIEDMSKVRIITAERLSESWQAPHVTQHDKADISAVEEYRKKFGGTLIKSGVRLTITSIMTKIVCHALKNFPIFNCSIDIENRKIIYKNYYNIGIAVDTDRGLLVPVIKDADKKNIIEISKEITDISERARNKKIKPDELQDSTFTISNLGGIGGTYFTPIINGPNVSILGLSRSVIEPVYIDNEFNPRLMLPLSLSYDHRIIDGADAARFISWISDALENPINALMHS